MLINFLSVLLVLTSITPSDMQDNLQPEKVLNASEKDIQWFRDAKFGLFITWGPVSLVGTEISLSSMDNQGDGAGPGIIIPRDVYEKLYLSFDPCKFDAKEWIDLAQAAGIKYIVFITKHSDGFSMFDTRLSDYKVTRSPYARDITAEIAKACHEAGMRLGLYYCLPDWYHTDFRGENHARVIEYVHGQLRELVTNYGRVDVLWFDSVSLGPERYDSRGIFKILRQLQPAILLNDRAGLPGDFEAREDYIGCFETDRPWESIEILGSQWAWKPNDVIHTPQEVIRLLVKCVGRDGNLLMNVGPMSSGKFDPNQVKCLREVGSWLKKYGESIYGTRGGPFVVRPLGCDWADNIGIRGCEGGGPYVMENVVSTRKDHFIYLHVLRWSEGPLVLPPIPRKIVSNSVLTGGTAEISQTERSLEVNVAGAHRDAIDTIIKLELDESAETIPPIRPYP
jgi:alpha-L-fucosidase